MQKITLAKPFKTKGLSKVVVCSLTTGTDAVEKRGIVAKMMKAWEAKATKRAANATGFTLMAVSLAACNDSTADTSVADAALATLRTDLGVADDATTTEMMNAVTALEDAASSAAMANVAAQTALANLRTDLGVAADATTTEMMAAITALETGSAQAQTALTALRTDLGVAADASTNDMMVAITALETAATDAADALSAATTGLAALRTDLGLAADATTADMISAITALETAAANAANDAVLALGITGVSTLADLAAAYDALANPVVNDFALTSGVDSGTSFVGNANANTFNAGLTPAGGNTLNALDSLDGAGGIDTLNATIVTGVTPGAISNIEVVNVTFNAAVALNASNMSGMTSITNIGSGALGTISNLSSTTPTLAVIDNAAGATFTYQASAVTGTADAVSLTVNNVTAGTTTITGAIETLNLTSSGSANTLGALTVSADTLNIFGSENLTITAANTVSETINAGTATGAVTLTSNNANATTITTGSGADSVTVTGGAAVVETVSTGAGADTVTFSANLDDVDVLDGGAGTDTLVAIGADMVGLTAAANITNFEALTVSDATSTLVLTTATVQAGIEKVTLAGAATSGTVNFEAGSKTLALTAANVTALTVNDTGLGVNDSLAITTSNTVDVLGAVATTINGFETVSLDTGTATAKTSGTIDINGDPDAAGVNTAATLTLTGAASLTVTGAVTLGATGATGTIDASAMTGAYVAATAVVGATILKGGSGADTFVAATGTASNIQGNGGIDTLTGSSAADTISGGDGNDILHGSAGDDIMTGDAGNDTFRMTDAELTATVTLSGGEGTDVLLIEDLQAVADAQFTLVSSVETLTSAATGLSATLGAEAMDAGITTVTFVGTNALGVIDTVTVAAGFTNALTVNLDTLDLSATETNVFDAGASVSAVNFVADLATDITGAVSAGDLALTGGTSANDTLTTVAGTYIAADLVSITGVETFVVSNDASASFTISDSNATATQSLTIDGRAIVGTANALTVVGTAEDDGVIIVHGSAGADAITGTVTATLGDTIYGYAGADVITIAVDALQAADVIDGGAGSDTLRVSGTGTLIDADFTGVTNIEKFTHTGTSTLTTLGAQYMESGSVEITLDANTNALNLDAITNNQILNLVAGDDTVDASAMTGALNVKLAVNSLDTNDTLTGGTGTADTLTITYGGTALAAGDVSGVTGFEKVVAATNVAGNFVVADANTVAAGALELDFTALTSTIATIDLALETNAGITVNTGGGNDDITMSVSSVGDTINAGAGNDGIKVTVAGLTSADTVDGGAGTDTLTFSDAGAVADANFTNVSNIEALTLANGTNTIVLGAEYVGSGSVTITGGTGDDSITLGSGVTTAQTIALATAGDDVVNATGATGAITVTMDDADLTAGDTLTGGSGADVLVLTGSTTNNAVTEAEMANVTSFETIKVAGANGLTLTLNDANTVGGVITFDASVGGAVTFSAAAEDDGTIVYIGGAGVDTVTGTTGADTIGGGAGADVITGGNGADTITGGTGSDRFVYTAAAQSTGSARDSITDFTSAADGFNVTLDLSTQVNAVTIDGTVQTARAGTTEVQANMSGAIGQVFYDTDNSRLVINANADNLVTTLDYQIDVNAATTAANTIVEGDINFTVTGGAAGDTITTGGGADTINGGAGADTINSGAGNDTITGGADADAINAGAGTNTITDAGVGADVITHNSAGATVVATATSTGTITLTASQAGATVTAAGVAVTVNASTSTAAVTLTKTGAGTDVATFTGGSGDDIITGGAGADVIVGGAGADTITGGGGADVITGGLGADTITLGAAGAIDTIVMTTGGAIAVDSVSGFVVAVGEDELQVDLSDLNGITGTMQLADVNGVLATGATSTLTVTALASAGGDFGATAASLVTITGATAYTAATLEAAIEGSGTAVGLTAGDSILIMYDDTVNSYLALLTDNVGTANGTAFADITITNLLEFTGVGAAETFLTTSFAIIA